MNVIRKFFAFWYDFIVGDDWRVALGVVLGLAICALLVASGALDGRLIAILFLLGVVVSLAVSLGVAVKRGD